MANFYCDRNGNQQDLKRLTGAPDSQSYFHPDLDTTIWLRTCTKEVDTPINGHIFQGTFQGKGT